MLAIQKEFYPLKQGYSILLNVPAPGTARVLVHVLYAPMKHQFFFFLMVGYERGTAVVLIGYVYPFFWRKWSNYSFFFFYKTQT